MAFSCYSFSSVFSINLANDAVTTGKIKDGEVTSADIKDGTVTSTDIASGTIPSGGWGTLEVTQRLAGGRDIPPGSSGVTKAGCLDDEAITGGGFNLGRSPDLLVMTSARGDNNGWPAGAINPATATEKWSYGCIAECGNRRLEKQTSLPFFFCSPSTIYNLKYFNFFCN
jgi:hypothetical protein